MTEWIISSNPKYFRTDDALRDLGKIEWYQTNNIKNIQIGDIVYIYISSPIKEIHWKCKVNDVNRMVSLIDDTKYYQYDVSNIVFSGPFVELEVVTEYPMPELLSYDNLKNNGLTNKLMGPCKVKNQLSAYLASADHIQSDYVSQNKYLNTIPISKLQALAVKHSGKCRKLKTMTTSYFRSPYISAYAKKRANGRCQLCNSFAPFIDEQGEPFLETHHIDWLSKGGNDTLDNVVALCPNCHRKMHVVNDQNDIIKLKSVLTV